MNKDGTEMHCCLWAEWLWRHGYPCQLRLREDKGRKIRERKRKGRKRKRRGGVERAKWREKWAQQVHQFQCQRIVSWEGMPVPTQVSWPCDPRVNSSSGCLCPHPVTLYHAQEHCLLCDLQIPPSSSIATPRKRHSNIHPSAGEEQGTKADLLWTMRATGQDSFCTAAKPLSHPASSSHLWGGHHQAQLT